MQTGRHKLLPGTGMIGFRLPRSLKPRPGDAATRSWTGHRRWTVEGLALTRHPQLLPGTGRGTMRSMVEGLALTRPEQPLHHAATRRGSPPRTGEERRETGIPAAAGIESFVRAWTPASAGVTHAAARMGTLS